jgi:hypothetical protein
VQTGIRELLSSLHIQIVMDPCATYLPIKIESVMPHEIAGMEAPL